MGWSINPAYYAAGAVVGVGRIPPIGGAQSFPAAPILAGNGRWGEAYQGDGVKNGDIITAARPISTTAFTLVALVEFFSSGSNQSTLDRDINTRRSFQLRRTSSSTIELIRFNTAVSSVVSATTSGTVANYTPAVIVAVVNGLNHAVYLRRERASAAITGTPQTWDGILGVGAGWAGTAGTSGFPASQVLNGNIFAYAAIPYAIPDGEAAEIASSPEAMFGKLFVPRRIWVPVSTGGGDVSTALSGQAATASAGTLASARTVAASGQAATASAGTVSPSRTIALSGQAVTASAGTVVQSKSVAVSGQAATASAGTLAQTRTLALSGQAATVSAGTVTYTADGNVTIALSGQAVTASAGTVAPAMSRAVSGQSAAASAGTMAPGRSLTCSVSQITTSAGTLSLGIVVPLAGQAATAGAGTVTYSTAGAVIVALTGQAVEVSAGTLAYAELVPLDSPLFARTAAAQARRIGRGSLDATDRRIGSPSITKPAAG